MACKTEWKTLKVSDGTEMRVFTARPDPGKGKIPAVIVVQEAFGVNTHIRNVCERIAGLGYIAVSPEMFHRTAPGFDGSYDDIEKVRPHMAAMTDEGQAADLQAVHQFLKEDAQADEARVAAVGYCMGGRTAFLANAVLPLKCAVSYYGGRIPSLLPKFIAQNGPLLFFWGGLDKHIPLEQRQEVLTALEGAGKPFINVEFSEADHGFFCEDRKVYHPVSAGQSWALFTQFLQDNL